MRLNSRRDLPKPAPALLTRARALLLVGEEVRRLYAIYRRLLAISDENPPVRESDSKP